MQGAPSLERGDQASEEVLREARDARGRQVTKRARVRLDSQRLYTFVSIVTYFVALYLGARGFLHLRSTRREIRGPSNSPVASLIQDFSQGRKSV